MQVSFIFNMYMQLIIAGLKTSLHLTPFCLLELILAIIKKRKKFYLLNIGVCQIANQTLLSFDWQFDFSPFQILSVYFLSLG